MPQTTKKKITKITRKNYPDLRDLFLLKLQALYDIEEQLIKALPKMVEYTTDEELRQGLEDHLGITKVHALRIEEAFATLGKEADTTKVEAIRGLIDDAEWIMKNIDVATVRDAGIISCAQNVEHYEIGAYGTAVEWATLLGYDRIAESLKETLAEESSSSDNLAVLANTKIDQEALGADENTEE